MQRVCALIGTSLPSHAITAAALHDVQSLAAGFFGIADERVVELARAQRAVHFVAAVGEGFRSDSESSFTKNFEHLRSRETDEHDVAAPSRDALSQWLRQSRDCEPPDCRVRRAA